MDRRKSAKTERGTTLVEVLVAVALMTMIFLFLTFDLLRSSQAENLASNHTQTMTGANYLFSVIKGDANFWTAGEWGTGPGLQDPCKVAYPPYTDTLTVPTWHPLCSAIFPQLTGAGVNANYMWNAQLTSDPNIATITIWVETSEQGIQDIYEMHGTRVANAPTPSYSGTLPQEPSPSISPTSPPPSRTPGPSPSPRPSPSRTPTPSPTPTPTNTGIFE